MEGENVRVRLGGKEVSANALDSDWLKFIGLEDEALEKEQTLPDGELGSSSEWQCLSCLQINTRTGSVCECCGTISGSYTEPRANYRNRLKGSQKFGLVEKNINRERVRSRGIQGASVYWLDDAGARHYDAPPPKAVHNFGYEKDREWTGEVGTTSSQGFSCRLCHSCQACEYGRGFLHKEKIPEYSREANLGPHREGDAPESEIFDRWTKLVLKKDSSKRWLEGDKDNPIKPHKVNSDACRKNAHYDLPVTSRCLPAGENRKKTETWNLEWTSDKTIFRPKRFKEKRLPFRERQRMEEILRRDRPRFPKTRSPPIRKWKSEPLNEFPLYRSGPCLRILNEEIKPKARIQPSEDIPLWEPNSGSSKSGPCDVEVGPSEATLHRKRTLRTVKGFERPNFDYTGDYETRNCLCLDHMQQHGLHPTKCIGTLEERPDITELHCGTRNYWLIFQWFEDRVIVGHEDRGGLTKNQQKRLERGGSDPRYNIVIGTILLKDSVDSVAKSTIGIGDHQ